MLPVKITLKYEGGANEDGAQYSFQHEAEVRDEGEAITVGREFARLCHNISLGANEGFAVVHADVRGDEPDADVDLSDEPA